MKSEMANLARNCFFLGVSFEASLAVLAAGLGYIFKVDIFEGMEWGGPALAHSLVACVPMFLLFLYVLHSAFPPWVRLRTFLEREAAPIFRNWSVPQLAVISLLAGWGEELLFRGFFQAWIERGFGIWPAVAVSAALFGLAHCMTAAYFWLATGIGVYLSWVWIASSNLAVPILVHALYDFAAIYYFVRIYGRTNS